MTTASQSGDGKSAELSQSSHSHLDKEHTNKHELDMLRSSNSGKFAEHKKCDQMRMRLYALTLLICGPTKHSSRRRFWYISFIFVASAYLMCLADVLTEYRWQSQPNTTLPDLGFDIADILTPFITKWTRYPDISVSIFVICTLFWILLDGPRKQKLSVLRRYLTMVALLYLGRSLCVISTQLPTPFHTASYDDQTWSGNVFYEAFLVLIRVKSTNDDVFYSGHTVVITLCALVLDTYCMRRWLIYLMWTWSIFSLYVIIATKFHYTIDVVIAFILSVVVWKFYHLAMRVEEIRNQLPVFRCFESDQEMEIYQDTATNTPLLNACNHCDGYNLNKVTGSLILSEPSEVETSRNRRGDEELNVCERDHVMIVSPKSTSINGLP